MDINYLYRNPLWPVEFRYSTDWPKKVGTHVLDVYELAAGKLHALLERHAARDIFDSHRLLTEWNLDTEKLRKAFAVYAGMRQQDWKTMTIEQVNFDVEDNKNYPKDRIEEIAKLTADLLSKVFNKITEENLIKSKGLTVEDFMNLANSLIDIKNTKFSTNLTYKIEDSITDANLHFGINEYSMDLAISNKDKERYNGMLTLSDPFKIINAKTKFAHEIVLPLIEKISGDDKSSLDIMQKYISNIENNAFEALRVFSKIPELTQGDKFEADFSYEPKSFSLKINNKSFLEIITDEKIVKFLRGFYTQADNQALPAAEASSEDQHESVLPNEEISASSTNNNSQDNPTP
ncbi:MAG: hypothetical protein EBS33_05165 [Alphaproteobacteria bacterium]|nr:hypothetical protein [Alphaproteobacteria bacterium]